MAGFEAKAKAIWSALDEMADKNPDMYKQFINDQLNGEGAQEMMKQLNLGTEIMASTFASSSTNRKMATSSKSQKTGVAGSVSATTSKTRSVLTTSSGRVSLTTTPLEASKRSCQNSDNRTTMTMTPSNSLLDDTFTQPNSNLLLNPFLAQIVANDGEEDEDLITELRLPQKKGNGDSENEKKSHKVLIEEM